MSGHRGYRDASRVDWGCSLEYPMTDERIKLGALLRIADAVEAMAKPFQSLLSQVKHLEERRSDQDRENARLGRRINALRGVITRQKRGRK